MLKLPAGEEGRAYEQRRKCVNSLHHLQSFEDVGAKMMLFLGFFLEMGSE